MSQTRQPLTIGGISTRPMKPGGARTTLSPMADTDASLGRKVVTFFKRLVIAAIVLALGGLAVFLLSQQNARLKLEEAQHQIEEAISQLKIATEGQNRHARSANQMLMVVEPEAKVMVDVLRKAVNALSQPAKGAQDPSEIAAPPEPEKAAP